MRHAASPGSSGLLGLRASHIAIGTIALPLAYYAYAESYRYYILKKRQAIYANILRGNPAHSQVVEAIKERFASLQCLLTGRYLNVTFDWREPGFWEFVIHQLLKPLSGRVWWNGGYSTDEEKARNVLLEEKLDIARIRKNSWRSQTRSQGKTSSHATTPENHERTSSPPSSSESEADWEKLEASRSGPTPAIVQDLLAGNSFEMTATWFGQSTTLVQMEGTTFLTDPVFSDKPLDSFLAPKRLRPPPCSLEELLALDVVDYVLISHDHYDHLDIDVVRRLGNKVTWIIPKGLRRFFGKEGILSINLVELDWWQEHTLQARGRGDTVSVACTPAQHWSGRTPLDTNKSLWCGYVVKHGRSGRSFFHAGDTGYSTELYEAVGKAYGPIDLGLIPIGSFEPRWMMSKLHTDPQGSVRIHNDLKIKHSIGVHWGTWIMSDEHYDDPIHELQKAKIAGQVADLDFITLPVGRSKTL